MKKAPTDPAGLVEGRCAGKLPHARLRPAEAGDNSEDSAVTDRLHDPIATLILTDVKANPHGQGALLTWDETGTLSARCAALTAAISPAVGLVSGR